MNLHLQPPKRRGYTLAEMLIVVTIMIMLVAVTLPIAKKIADGSQTREASRQFSAILTTAKMRALQTGRPCGIYLPFNVPTGFQDNSNNISTTGNNPNFTRYWPVRQVTQVALAEVPPSYSGSTTSVFGKIVQNYNIANQYCFVPVSNGASVTADTNEIPALASLLNKGEEFFVRFDYKGNWYRCQYNATAQSPYYFVWMDSSQTRFYPPGYGDATSMAAPVGTTAGKSFQIMRAPRPAASNPVDLPRGTCIDITFSGVGDSEREFRLLNSNGGTLGGVVTGLMVMFSPTGAVDSVYVNTKHPTSGAVQLGVPLTPPAGTLFFLLGKTDKVSNPFDLSQPNAADNLGSEGYANLDASNLADPNSIWVAISRATGQMTTAENMPLASLSGNTYAAFKTYLQRSREAAIRGEQITGR